MECACIVKGNSRERLVYITELNTNSAVDIENARQENYQCLGVKWSAPVYPVLSIYAQNNCLSISESYNVYVVS